MFSQLADRVPFGVPSVQVALLQQPHPLRNGRVQAPAKCTDMRLRQQTRTNDGKLHEHTPLQKAPRLQPSSASCECLAVRERRQAERWVAHRPSPLISR